MRKSLFGFLGLFLLLTACEKPESKIGLELLPESENLGFAIDSSTVILNQVLQDSLVTSRLVYSLLGDLYDDQVVGNTKAKLFTQIRLSNPNVDFGNNAEIDSLVLSFAYSGDYYGSLDDFQISVKRITDTLNLDSSYYSYDDLAVDEMELVDPSRNIITPAPEEDVVVGEDTLDPHIRIKLDNNWGTEYLMNADPAIYENNESFIEHLHGFKITATTLGANGGIVYLNLIPDLSNMTLYYSLDDDTLSYEFSIGSSNQQFVKFEHEYNNMIINNISNETPETEEVIIQSTAGLGVEVTLPNISDFTEEENIIINRAVLLLPVVDAGDMDMFPPHDAIKAIMTIDGIEVNIPDAVLSSSSSEYVGGVYDEENKVYSVTVTRFIQQVLNGKIEEPIFTVYPTFSRTIANRTRIKVGSLLEDRRTKLIINYTTF